MFHEHRLGVSFFFCFLLLLFVFFSLQSYDVCVNLHLFQNNQEQPGVIIQQPVIMQQQQQQPPGYYSNDLPPKQ